MIATEILAAVVVAETAALIVLVVRLRRRRRELAELERRLRPVPATGAIETAGRVVRTVARQVARVREGGVSHLLSSSVEELIQWATADRARIALIADQDGTVTLFFSDIADSTARNEELGDADWVRVLGAHDQVVRREIEGRDGVVVKTMGDGFMAVFARPAAALSAAVAIHRQLQISGRRLRRARLSARIGVHTGTAISSGDDYLGRNVALCARIAAHARGGQTLASVDTRDAAGDAAGLTFRSQGDVAFKGIVGVVEVFDVTR